MKLKITVTCSGISFLFFFLLLFMVVFFVDDTDSGRNNKDFSISQSGVTVSRETSAHRPLVGRYGKKYGIEDHVSYILVIIQVESGGTAGGVMQSSESLGLSPNSLRTEESIKQGAKYFSELLTSAEQQGVDTGSMVQSYDYGGGFLNYVVNHGRVYTYGLAGQFPKKKPGGQKTNYLNLITIPVNGGWQYNHRNQFHVQLASQYLTATSPTGLDGGTVQVIADEVLKYERLPYVLGGASPTTSFDCSSLIQWVYDKAGISLPCAAQDQHDATQEISMEETQVGSLTFSHSTHNAGTCMIRVSIYVGDNRMFRVGDPIGYTDLNTNYWQDCLTGARRTIHD